MASIAKRKKSKFWTACYTDRDGRQLKRSAKTTDRNQAMRIAIELERAESQVRQGAATVMQFRKIVSDVSEKITGENLEVPNVENYLNGWLIGIEARNTKSTLDRYRNTVKLFLKSLNGKAQKPVTAVTPQDVENFLNWRLNAGFAPQTAIIDLKTLNTAFRRAELYGTILKNPVAAVQLPKSESSERDVFTHDEVQQLLNAAPTLDWQTLIMLGYFCAARLSDCVRMTWDNVHADKNVIIYEQMKTGRKVTVPMHPHLIEHLHFKLQFGTIGFLCPKLAGKGTGGKHGLSEAFKRVVVKAGLDLMPTEGKGVRKFNKRTFHSLRHSFNSQLANAGVSDEVRMKLTGHSSKVMNARYTHLQLDTLKNAVATLPKFGAK